MTLIGLQAPGVAAVIAPDLGGRVLSLRFDGAEVLWHDPALLDDGLRPRVEPDRAPLGAGFARWRNWGGEKTWPAPQGWDGDGWPGPPDGVIDGGRYEVLHRSDRDVHLRSAVEPATGLRIERRMRVEPGALEVTSTVRNEADAPATWAAWSVAQCAFDDTDVTSDAAGIEVGVAGSAAPVVLFAPVGTIGWRREPGRIVVPFARAVGKLGFPDATGAVSLVRADGSGVTMSFAVHGDAGYPDGSPFQLWSQTPVDGPLPGLDGLRADAAYVELEALSPRRALAPGEHVDLVVRWSGLD